MRSPSELAFRCRQEAANVRLWLAHPSPIIEQPSPLPGLPDPSAVACRLEGTPFAGEVERLAASLLEHRFPLLGLEIETSAEIHWRRDYVHQIESGLDYFRFVPYLDFQRVGDHKIVWELNRHQHLVVLAQAWLFTRRGEFLREIWRQLESWIPANPYMRGVNWTSALEAAFRALSWLWVYHFAGTEMDSGFRSRFLAALYRHGRYLERNLSIYFSPNTHLLGEAVALHALGALLPAFPDAGRWRHVGARLIEQQMHRQVHDDGSHFEQATYYHLYAADMFLFHQALAETRPGFRDKLRRMAEYLAALGGPGVVLPMIGDEDGGRFFHPYGDRAHFLRATLATCSILFEEPAWLAREEDLCEQAAWWLGPSCLDRSAARPAPQPASRFFPDAGVAVMNAGDLHCVVDAGPFGEGSGGHSHSDTLSVAASLGGDEILIDCGTFTYLADPELRLWFRSSAAHNTLSINGRDQALASGPFRWIEKPATLVRQWATCAAHDFLDAECCYAAFIHRRRVFFFKPDLLLILDDVNGPAGEHEIEQFWHFGVSATESAPGRFLLGARARMLLPPGEHAELSEGGRHGWRSPVYGTKERAPVLRIHRNAALPARFWAMLDLSGSARATFRLEGELTCVVEREDREIAVRFDLEGIPEVRSAAA